MKSHYLREIADMMRAVATAEAAKREVEAASRRGGELMRGKITSGASTDAFNHRVLAELIRIDGPGSTPKIANTLNAGRSTVYLACRDLEKAGLARRKVIKGKTSWEAITR